MGVRKGWPTAYLSLHLENSMGEVRSMAEQAQIQASNAVAQATTNYDLLTNKATYGLSAIKAKLTILIPKYSTMLLMQ
jgi:uncharacterized protein (UPF0333 family)